MSRFGTHNLLLKGLFSLLFFFSLQYSFSFTRFAPEDLTESNETCISDFSITNHCNLHPAHHNSEIPESPADESPVNEVEKEVEDDDDNKDEKGFYTAVVKELSYPESVSSEGFQSFNFVGIVVPYYILFHSWKSFIG